MYAVSLRPLNSFPNFLSPFTNNFYLFPFSLSFVVLSLSSYLVTSMTHLSVPSSLDLTTLYWIIEIQSLILTYRFTSISIQFKLYNGFHLCCTLSFFSPPYFFSPLLLLKLFLLLLTTSLIALTYAKQDRDAKRKLATSSGGGMLSSLTGGVLGGGGMTGIVGNLAGNYVGKFFG